MRIQIKETSKIRINKTGSGNELNADPTREANWIRIRIKNSEILFILLLSCKEKILKRKNLRIERICFVWNDSFFDIGTVVLRQNLQQSGLLKWVMKIYQVDKKKRKQDVSRYRWHFYGRFVPYYIIGFKFQKPYRIHKIILPFPLVLWSEMITVIQRSWKKMVCKLCALYCN
jgi:hypothetical protein